jgi:hypothetical protein
MTQQLMIAYPVSCSDDLAYDEFISAAFTAAGLDGLLEEQGSGLGFGMRDHDYFFTEDISLGWHESDQHENPLVNTLLALLTDLHFVYEADLTEQKINEGWGTFCIDDLDDYDEED